MVDAGDAYAEIEKRKADEREDEAPVERKDMEFLGQILTANVQWSQDLSNKVEDNLRRDAKDWRDSFMRLWDAIDQANIKVDSMRINAELMGVSHLRDRADQPFYWEKENL